MGNHKFRLSDMIPNSWFYKLKYINKTSKTTHLKNHHHHRLSPPPAPPSSPPTATVRTTNQSQPRKSYHFTRELTPPLEDHYSLSPPRKSKSSSKSKKPTKKNNNNNNSNNYVSSTCSCKSTSTFQSHLTKSQSPSPSPLPETEHFDIVINVDKQSLTTKINDFNYRLPPIITKPDPEKPRILIKDEKFISPNLKEQRNSPPSRRFSVGSPGGVKLKINSPRIIGRKQGQNGYNSGRKSVSSSKKRRSISESFAVVKSSFDPQRDFRESMVEMIVQNNLRASKDLEDLLACYLTLNSDEYHDVIVKVFKQIWFDVRRHKLDKF